MDSYIFGALRRQKYKGNDHNLESGFVLTIILFTKETFFNLFSLLICILDALCIDTNIGHIYGHIMVISEWP